MQLRAIIIEDENSAVKNLMHLLQKIEPTLSIIEVIDTVTDSIGFFKKGAAIDLIFMDIHLADGNSFEILEKVDPPCPIIFTTAYDHYAIKAFKTNSIDYLLKPIQEEELEQALEKFKKNHQKPSNASSDIQNLIQFFQNEKKSFRETFLVQKADKLIPIPVSDFSYFFIENGIVRGVTFEKQTFHLDGKLENIEQELNPKEFFRANRQYLINRTAIQNLQVYFNGRFIVNLNLSTTEQIIVSKANAPKIKAWLNQG